MAHAEVVVWHVPHAGQQAFPLGLHCRLHLVHLRHALWTGDWLCSSGPPHADGPPGANADSAEAKLAAMQHFRPTMPKYSNSACVGHSILSVAEYRQLHYFSRVANSAAQCTCVPPTAP
jgi:hypothetical protein